MNNQDIELIREAAKRVTAFLDRRAQMGGIDKEHIHGIDVSPEGGFELTVSDLRTLCALADREEERMEKAEPVATVMHEEFATIKFNNLIDCDLPCGTKLFTHADTGEVEKLKALLLKQTNASGAILSRKQIEIAELEAQLSAIQKASMDDNPSRAQREIKSILNTIAPEKQQEGTE